MEGDIIVFFVLATIAIFSAVMVMESQEIFHAALFLALLFVSIGGVYILLTAEFIAAMQILVYAGAVVVLILFAIVLTRRDSSDIKLSTKHLMFRTFIGFTFIVLLIYPILEVPWPNNLVEYPNPNTYTVGFSLFTEYVIPFEIVSIALLSALIGAIYLSKREDDLP